MTRKEYIDHFMAVVNAVHLAEEKLRPEWEERLSEMPHLTDKEQNERAMSYIRAVATEVVSGTSDEELANM
jgi:hemerythrin superfamily protein